MRKLKYRCKHNLYWEGDLSDMDGWYIKKPAFKGQKPAFKKGQIVDYDKEVNLSDQEYDRFFVRVDNDTTFILDECIKKAGLTSHKPDFVTMSNFTTEVRNAIMMADRAYYRGDEEACEKELKKAIRILKQAKVFNEHFGL